MSESINGRNSFAKVATILAVTLGIGFGLCGIGAAGASVNQGHGAISTIAIGVLIAGAAFFWLSVLGFVITFCVWVVVAIVRSGSRNSSGSPSVSHQPPPFPEEFNSMPKPPETPREDSDD